MNIHVWPNFILDGIEIDSKGGDRGGREREEKGRMEGAEREWKEGERGR